MTTTENSLQVTTFEQAVSLKGRKAIEFFSDQSNIDPLIEFVKKEATATVFNVNLKKDRDAIGALALKISKSRKALSEAIKNSVFELETKVKAAKSVNKYMEEELNEVRNQVKAPRDEWQANQDRIEQERIEEIRGRISEIRDFGNYNGTESKEEIANLIEAVESIDVSQGFKELAGEAATAIKEVIKALNDRVLQIIEEARQREQAELLQKEKLRNQVADRLNKLAMIPMGMLGKGSEEIERMIELVGSTPLNEEEFGESYQAAIESVNTVLGQLELMLSQQKQLESTAPIDMPSVSGQPDPVGTDDFDHPNNCLGCPDCQGIPASDIVEALNDEPLSSPSITNEVIVEFLEGQLNDVTDFGYLLVSPDPKQNNEAMANLRAKFKVFIGEK